MSQCRLVALVIGSLALGEVDGKSCLSAPCRRSALVAPAVPPRAPPPPNRHGAEPEDHSCVAYKCARQPRAPHPFTGWVRAEKASACALGTACEPGRHGPTPTDKSAHSPHVTECADLRAGSQLSSVLYRNVPKVLTVHASVTVGDADCTELMFTSAVGSTRDSYSYGSYS